MHYAFPFLPLEVQTSIKEMLALGVPDSAVDLLIERTAKAIEAKTISAQRDVIEIGESADRRVEQIGDRMEDRMRVILGETNGMLVEVRSGVQNVETALTQARAEFRSGLSAVGERLSGAEQDIDDLKRTVAAHDQSRDRSIEDRRLLRQDMDESKQHRARLQRTLDTELPAMRQEIAALRGAIERLEQNGQRHEAGG